MQINLIRFNLFQNNSIQILRSFLTAVLFLFYFFFFEKKNSATAYKWGFSFTSGVNWTLKKKLDYDFVRLFTALQVAEADKSVFSPSAVLDS